MFFFADVMIRNLKDSNEIIYSINDSMEICLKLRAIRNMENVNVSVSITREDGVYCYGTNTTFDNMPRIDVIFDKEYNLKFIFESIKLLPGKYFLNVGVYNDVNKEYDVIWNAKKFYIKADNYNKEIGVFQMQHKWIYLS